LNRAAIGRMDKMVASLEAYLSLQAPAFGTPASSVASADQPPEQQSAAASPSSDPKSSERSGGAS
jgi:hypothetical protein